MHSGEICYIMTVICSEPSYPLPLEGGCPKGKGLAPTDDSWRFSLSVIPSEAEGSPWQEGKW